MIVAAIVLFFYPFFDGINRHNYESGDFSSVYPLS